MTNHRADILAEYKAAGLPQPSDRDIREEVHERTVRDGLAEAARPAPDPERYDPAEAPGYEDLMRQVFGR